MNRWGGSKGLRSAPAGDLLVGPGVSVEGTVIVPGSGMVRIEGSLSGTIRCGGTIIIAGDARVKARIQAGALVVAGFFEGSAEVSEQIRVAAGAEVHADCAGSALVLEPGARFNGKFERRQTAIAGGNEANSSVTGAENDR